MNEYGKSFYPKDMVEFIHHPNINAMTIGD
jgi:hypothetical protein